MADIHAQWLGCRFDEDPDWYRRGVLVTVDTTSPDVVVFDFPRLGMSSAYAVLPGQTPDEVREAYWRDRGHQIDAAKLSGL